MCIYIYIHMIYMYEFSTILPMTSQTSVSEVVPTSISVLIFQKHGNSLGHESPKKSHGMTLESRSMCRIETLYLNGFSERLLSWLWLGTNFKNFWMQLNCGKTQCHNSKPRPMTSSLQTREGVKPTRHMENYNLKTRQPPRRCAIYIGYQQLS